MPRGRASRHLSSAPEWLVIDQDLHTAPSETLEGVSAGDASEERKRHKTPTGSAAVWAVGIGALIIGSTLVYGRLSPEGNVPGGAKPPAAPVPVTVTEVSTRDVPVYLDGLGTVQAANAVAIRTQVDGKLQSVNFVEGQHVRKGDVLAVVDPRPYQEVVDQAKAKRVEDEAQLLSDQKDLDRFKILVVKGAGTQQAVDQQQAKVDNLKATIEADQAAIESAETQLSYATIVAPIDGNVGFRQVDAGNIVHAADQTPITVLTQIKPAMAVFTLPQRDLGPVREAMPKGSVPVLAFDQDNTRQLATGALLLIDNQIDQATSTIRLKASFPNEDERLWPGEFVRVRVLVDTLNNVATVPPAVVQRSSQGLFAWVIAPDNVAENRPISTGPSDDEETVVTSGLKSGERVVVRGQYRLRPGVKVDAHDAEATVAKTIAP
jgi:multidrug efflux system membrane fusion protein